MKTKTSIFIITILLGVIVFALPLFVLQTVLTSSAKSKSLISKTELLNINVSLFADNSGIISNARSTTTNEIPLTAGDVTLSSVTDIYYSNGVLYATDGSYIIALPIANE